ncbi:Protein ABCI7, chloroplastic [Vitis vinifera]|uniref:Protein ABCI7, chloroplastic n=1 Tax=Vitis vinifera TaxID=29760 RepID=A0A438J3G6_VITVI|nr:Protein ABCI7, chloroplastic [Vitis vinifera]
MPLHIVYYSVEGGDIGFKKLPVSNPRVFVLVEEGGEIGEIEELVGGGENKCYWANAVTEVRHKVGPHGITPQGACALD